MHTIHFVTGNADKVAAMQAHLAAFGAAVTPVRLKLVEPQADTIQDVALSKALQAYEQMGQALVVEDSGFYIDGLNGFPGPYTKYVLATIGADGILRLAAELDSRVCRFVSALAYVDADGVARVFTSSDAGGLMADAVDPTPCAEAWSDLWRIYIPRGYDRTLNALTPDERKAMFREWQTESAYTLFARWYAEAR